MNKPTQILAGVLVAGSVLLAAGCGAPSVGDLKDGLVKEIPGLSGSQAECMARLMHDGGLSTDLLKKVAEGKADSIKTPSADDAKKLAAIEKKVEACK